MDKRKILFVVHRYYPFPGGSEYYVRDMAIEMNRRGYQVHVLAHEHRGDQEMIHVTNDYNVLLQNWDMIFIHGCDCISQNIALQNLHLIKSPVCYMIIKPSNSDTAIHGLKYADVLAYSTTMDIKHIAANGDQLKARRIRHGIPRSSLKIVNAGDAYVSAGGFYPHKGMTELAQYFNNAMFTRKLELYGYADGDKPNYPNVTSTLGLSKDEVLEKIAGAKGYILNSREEGFGLVLLEAMYNNVPVYARRIAGAKDMEKYVMAYDHIDELSNMINTYEALTPDEKFAILRRNHDYVNTNHTIMQTCNDIEDIIEEKGK